MKFKIFGKDTDFKKSKTLRKKRFYFTVRHSADSRGYNRTIIVSCLRKDGSPRQIGIVEAHTASYVGDSGAATQLISKVFGYKNDNYSFLRKDIELFEINY